MHGPVELRLNVKNLFDYKYRRHGRTESHQKIMERPRTLDPTDCKHAICHLNGTYNPQPHAFD